MKKIIIAICFLLIGSFSAAQDLKYSEVPEAVRSSFLDIHPDVVNVDWEKEGIYYEADFKYNNIETTLIFDVTGKVLFREEDIPVKTLPGKILEYSSEYLNSDKIDEADMITNDLGVITFKVEINDIDYLFDVEGNFISIDSGKDLYEDNDDRN